MRPRVAPVSGRSTTSMSVIASSASRPSAPWKQTTPGCDFSACAPAGDVEAERFELERRVEAEHAEAEHADLDVAPPRLIVVVRPDALALLALVAAELAQMRERVHDDPFAHPRRSDRDRRRARSGASGRAGSAKQMIDAGAEREDRLEVRKVCERARRMAPATAHSGPRPRSNGSPSVGDRAGRQQRLPAAGARAPRPSRRRRGGCS